MSVDWFVIAYDKGNSALNVLVHTCDTYFDIQAELDRVLIKPSEYTVRSIHSIRKDHEVPESFSVDHDCGPVTLWDGEFFHLECGEKVRDLDVPQTRTHGTHPGCGCTCECH